MWCSAALTQRRALPLRGKNIRHSAILVPVAEGAALVAPWASVVMSESECQMTDSKWLKNTLPLLANVIDDSDLENQ
jgi:hypothetical protein